MLITERGSTCKITIITVVFNGSREIEKTLKSIFAQSYVNKEVIVIDGGSTDGTLGIISNYKQYIDYFITEQDSGIYDAMNKGIRVADGEWICFMNIGDIFYSNDIISNIFSSGEIREDIIVGDCIVDFELFKRHVNTKSLSLIDYGMTFCHQSAFVKTKLYRQRYFNLKYTIAADFDFFYWCYISGVNFITHNSPFSIVTAGGLSDSMRVQVLAENRDIVRKYSQLSLKKELIYSMNIFWTRLKILVIKILPYSLVLFLKKIK